MLDEVTRRFREWRSSHDKQMVAERRLADALENYALGGPHPTELAAHVDLLRAESAVLLDAAAKALETHKALMKRTSSAANTPAANGDKPHQSNGSNGNHN